LNEGEIRNGEGEGGQEQWPNGHNQASREAEKEENKKEFLNTRGRLWRRMKKNNKGKNLKFY
jgi:hypothetical protein